MRAHVEKVDVLGWNKSYVKSNRQKYITVKALNAIKITTLLINLILRGKIFSLQGNCGTTL